MPSQQERVEGRGPQSFLTFLLGKTATLVPAADASAFSLWSFADPFVYFEYASPLIAVFGNTCDFFN